MLSSYFFHTHLLYGWFEHLENNDKWAPSPAQPCSFWSPSCSVDSILCCRSPPLCIHLSSAYQAGEDQAAVDTQKEGEDNEKSGKLGKPAGEGEEVGGEPDGDADEEECREDSDEGGGHAAAAAHASTLRDRHWGGLGAKRWKSEGQRVKEDQLTKQRGCLKDNLQEKTTFTFNQPKRCKRLIGRNSSSRSLQYLENIYYERRRLLLSSLKTKDGWELMYEQSWYLARPLRPAVA